MNPTLFTVLFSLLLTLHAAGQRTVDARDFAVAEGPGLCQGIPVWAIQGDTNLSWISDKMLLNTKVENKIIRSLCKTDPIFSSLDTVFDMPLDTIAQMCYLHDIDHDGKQDLLLYGMLGFCDFQPYVYILLKRGTDFQPIFHREGDIIGWQESEKNTRFQILVNGCCEDRHGYLYDFDPNTNTFVGHSFWQGNSEHPVDTADWEQVVLQRDSVILLPASGGPNSVRNNIKSQFNWSFFKGDTGIVLATKTIDDVAWCYVKMKVVKRDNANRLPDVDYIYGWVSAEDVRSFDFSR